MNLILVAENDLRDDGRIALDDRRARHIRTVIAPVVGDELRIGMLRGRHGLGRVCSLDDGGAVVLDPAWLEDADPVPPVDLILAMPRPKALARVLQTCASIGVRRIDIVNAWRVDKSYLKSPQLSAENLQRNLWLGCEQGATTWLPEVSVHRLLMPFMRGPLGTRLAVEETCAVLAHPREAHAIEHVFVPGSSQSMVAAIGPERGWIDRELSSFAELGFTPVRLGSRVLRCETAVTTLLAQVSLLRRLPAAG